MMTFFVNRLLVVNININIINNNNNQQQEEEKEPMRSHSKQELLLLSLSTLPLPLHLFISRPIETLEEQESKASHLQHLFFIFCWTNKHLLLSSSLFLRDLPSPCQKE